MFGNRFTIFLTSAARAILNTAKTKPMLCTFFIHVEYARVSFTSRCQFSSVQFVQLYCAALTA